MDPTSVNSLSRTNPYVSQIRLLDPTVGTQPADAQPKHGGQFDGRQASNSDGSSEDHLSRARDKLDSVVTRLRMVSAAISSDSLSEAERIRLRGELESIHVELQQIPGSPQRIGRDRPTDLRSAINVLSGMRDAVEHRLKMPASTDGYAQGSAEGDGTSISLSI